MELENKMVPMVVGRSGKLPECSRHLVAPYSTRLAKAWTPAVLWGAGTVCFPLSLGSRQGRRRTLVGTDRDGGAEGLVPCGMGKMS